MNHFSKIRMIVAIAAIGLAFTQSAFTPTKTGIVYGKVIDGSGFHWESLDALTEQTGDGPLGANKYRCDANESQICTANFSSQPAANTPAPIGARTGDYDSNP